MSFSFNMDDQIFLRNDQTNKIYTITINRNKNPTSYNVTREWSVPNQTQLASKTDRFLIFKQAAEHIEKLYNERIKNGYIEVMRRQGVIKQNIKTEKPGAMPITLDREDAVTGQPVGRQLETNFQSRHRTGISDRIEVLKKIVNR